MSLNSIRIIQRIIGVLLIASGVYLIFITQEFFGTLFIIVALLIFPTVSKRSTTDDNEHDNHPERSNELTNDYNSGGGD